MQTALVQDEALKRANARIEELQAQAARRDATATRIFGPRARRDPRHARPARLGAISTLTRTILAHNGSALSTAAGISPADAALSSGFRSGAGDGSGLWFGGSFLGTAASTAAGVIGGGLLLNSIRSMFGDHAGLDGHDRSALGGSSGSTADSYLAQQDRDQDQDDQEQEDEDQDQDQDQDDGGGDFGGDNTDDA